MTQRQNIQRAPYPQVLEDILAALDWRVPPGRTWRFKLRDMDRGPEADPADQHCHGLTLAITIYGPDTYNPAEVIGVNHLFPVPPATYDEQSWTRWLFERIRDVESHEAMEGFIINGKRPYAPVHAPGGDPYILHDLITVEQAETSFAGRRDVGSQS